MILAARYVLPISREHIENGAVLVRDGLIVEVGKRAEVVERHPDEEVIDYGLAAIAPGFVDAHTHLAYTVLRGLVDDLPYVRWKYEIMQREHLLAYSDWHDSALLGACEALACGITTVADITRTGASLRAVCESGLRGVVYREVETMEKPLVDGVMERAVNDIAAWEDAVDPTMIEIGISPHSTYACHPLLFQRIAEYAADGRPVAMHLAGSIEEYRFVKMGSTMLGFEIRSKYDDAAPMWLPTGVSPVRYVHQWEIMNVPRFTAIHTTQVDDDDIAILAEQQVSLATCSRCNAKLAMGTIPLMKMLSAGLDVGLGTDSPAATNTIGMFEEMRTGLLMQRAAVQSEHFFTAADFLYLATLGSARALGIDERVGSLDPGKSADIAVVDLRRSFAAPTWQPESAFVHTGSRADVRLTMVGGKVLFQDGSWTCADEERIRARNEEIRAKLRV
ncbi:MAG: amidohydrolase family protein [Actinomycetes bacterium]|jgi:5-methylthioadenosine/S-adenosylhomocysteine deaminase|nr:amidohydrolase family protein [Actinomycetes bacterium]